MDQPLEAVLLGKLRVTPNRELAEAIEQLTYIPGSATGCPNNLLVLGGQMLEMPPALTILPLDCLSNSGGHQVGIVQACALCFMSCLNSCMCKMLAFRQAAAMSALVVSCCCVHLGTQRK